MTVGCERMQTKATTLQWETTTQPNVADLDVVDSGLHLFNVAAADLSAVRVLACFARTADGEVIGGLRARYWGTAYEVQQVWVRDDMRRQGVATRLLAMIEATARERGGSVIYLDTFSFQAPALYLRNGFQVAARIDGFDERIVRYVMVKPLAPASGHR